MRVRAELGGERAEDQRGDREGRRRDERRDGPAAERAGEREAERAERGREQDQQDNQQDNRHEQPAPTADDARGDGLGAPAVLILAGAARDEQDRHETGQQGAERPGPPGGEAVDGHQVTGRPEDQVDRRIGGHGHGQRRAVLGSR